MGRLTKRDTNMYANILALFSIFGSSFAQQSSNNAANRLYNITLIISETESIFLDTIDTYQRFPTTFQTANETYSNDGLTPDSFDTLQKLILSELENVFDDLADVMAKFNDVVQKTCWTFENELEALRKRILLDFCDAQVFGWLSDIENSLISIADSFNETGDILDIYMTVIKSVLSSRSA